MGYRFGIIKREFENDALIAFIDLLGTRKLYESTLVEDQSYKLLRDLLVEFDIKFSEHFPAREIKQSFGRGIKFAHDYLEGLPIGVYVTARIKRYLNSEQQGRIIPVKDEKLYFIKKKTSIIPFLPNATLDLIIKKTNAERKAVMDSLKASFSDQDDFKKRAPWILVHLGKKNEIIRTNKPLKRYTAKRCHTT